MIKNLHVMNSDSGTLCGWLFQSLSVCCLGRSRIGWPTNGHDSPTDKGPQRTGPTITFPHNSLLYTKSTQKEMSRPATIFTGLLVSGAILYQFRTELTSDMRQIRNQLNDAQNRLAGSVPGGKITNVRICISGKEMGRGGKDGNEVTRMEVNLGIGTRLKEATVDRKVVWMFDDEWNFDKLIIYSRQQKNQGMSTRFDEPATTSGNRQRQRAMTRRKLEPGISSLHWNEYPLPQPLNRSNP